MTPVPNCFLFLTEISRSSAQSGRGTETWGTPLCQESPLGSLVINQETIQIPECFLQRVPQPQAGAQEVEGGVFPRELDEGGGREKGPPRPPAAGGGPEQGQSRELVYASTCAGAGEVRGEERDDGQWNLEGSPG